MKVAFIINPKINKKHEQYIADIENAFPFSTEYKSIDMSVDKPLHEHFHELNSYGANLIVTMDGAGLEMRTEMDEPVLNQMPQRVMHLFFDKPYKYGSELSEFFNLSHYVFLNNGTDLDGFMAEHHNIPNAYLLPDWENGDIKEWLVEMFREMML